MEPFAMCIDLTTGKTSTQPPVQMFSLKGQDMIMNEWHGVGGPDGKTSGVVSTPVAGGGMTAWGLMTSMSPLNFSNCWKAAA